MPESSPLDFDALFLPPVSSEEEEDLESEESLVFSAPLDSSSFASSDFAVCKYAKPNKFSTNATKRLSIPKFFSKMVKVRFNLLIVNGK